jgi:hypothetical protein
LKPAIQRSVTKAGIKKKEKKEKKKKKKKKKKENWSICLFSFVGPTHGRTFWGCAEFTPGSLKKGCSFFKWYLYCFAYIRQRPPY